MNFIIWLAVGGLIGWGASVLMGTDQRQGILLNIVVGVVGAFIGGALFGGYFGASTINDGNLSISSIVVSLVGAVILLAALRLLRGR